MMCVPASRTLPAAPFADMNYSRRDLLIGWSLLPFLTPARTRLLLEYFEPLERVCDAPVAVLQGLLSVDQSQAALVKSPLRSAVLEQVAALRERVVTLIDEDYPPLLREIIDPPLALHLRGDRSVLALPSIAIVGSRRASPYAINVARHFSERLTAAGIAVVSGLARGVDAAAHAAALDAGGKTIGVLGTGIDVVYPRTNRALHEQLEREGLILSEFPPGTPPLAGNFPMRNRLISGLTSGTLIVEATRRSGSLITARTAAEQGREVFAVPGPIFSEGSEGPHRLIQYGAKLVHDLEDILDELPRMPRRPAQTPVTGAPDEVLRDVLAAFDRAEARDVETVAAKLGRRTTEMAEALLQLELGGWLRALPGSQYIRTK